MEMQMHTNGTIKSITDEVSDEGFPWHQTLPEMLDEVQTTSQAMILGKQILVTKLPKNFRAVLSSWIAMCGRTGYSNGQVDDKLERLMLEGDEDYRAEIGSEAAGDDIGAER